MTMEIKVQDNFKRTQAELLKISRKILYLLGIKWLENVTREISSGFGKPIVDTGRLRASMSFITADVNGGNSGVYNSKPTDQINGNAPKNSLIMGTNVEYASGIETGTGKVSARPFLKNSIVNYAKDYKNIVEKELKK